MRTALAASAAMGWRMYLAGVAVAALTSACTDSDDCAAPEGSLSQHQEPGGGAGGISGSGGTSSEIGGAANARGGRTYSDDCG